jgi:hypothetical protein
MDEKSKKPVELVTPNEKSFWILALRKLVTNFLSIKVWIIIAVMAVSTYLCIEVKMTGGEWAAINGGVISTIAALREGFKVVSVRKNGSNKGIPT